MKKKESIKKEEFLKRINQKKTEDILQMIEAGVLESMDNRELKEVFPKLMALRSREIADLLAKKSHYFPMEMLDVPMNNHADKDYMAYVLEKHGKKFQYRKIENANRLFALACECDCKQMLLFLLGKGLAEGQYPRLIGGSDKLLEVLSEVRVRALHPDTVVTFFVEAAIAEQNDKRIQELIDLGFDIGTINSENKTACEVLSDGIQSYPYAKGKKGQAEKQKDEQGLKTLERFYKREFG